MKKYYAVILSDDQEAEEYWFEQDKFDGTCNVIKYKWQDELEKMKDHLLRIKVGVTVYFTPDSSDPNSKAIIKRIQ